jgi:hypothetical protein
MTYGDDSEDVDFEDEDEFDTSDLTDAEPDTPDRPITVDDTALQPSNGDRQ